VSLSAAMAKGFIPALLPDIFYMIHEIMSPEFSKTVDFDNFLSNEPEKIQ